MPGDKIEISTVSEKFKENFDQIDWGGLRDKPLPKPAPKKHVTAGMCGEFGMSTFDEKAFKENYDQIDWTQTKESHEN